MFYFPFSLPELFQGQIIPSLTPLTHGSQHAFSRNPIFPLPSFFTRLKAQKKLWPVLGAFCPEMREGGQSRSSNEVFFRRFELWRTNSCVKWDLGHLGNATRLTRGLPNVESALNQNSSLPSSRFVQFPLRSQGTPAAPELCSLGGLKKREQNRETQRDVDVGGAAQFQSPTGHSPFSKEALLPFRSEFPTRRLLWCTAGYEVRAFLSGSFNF